MQKNKSSSRAGADAGADDEARARESALSSWKITHDFLYKTLHKIYKYFFTYITHVLKHAKAIYKTDFLNK